MRTCGGCGSTMLPHGGVRVNGVRTTDSWKCPECGHGAVTITGCGWIFLLPTTAMFALMDCSLLERGWKGDEEGLFAGVLMGIVVAGFGLLIFARLRDAAKNPSAE